MRVFILFVLVCCIPAAAQTRIPWTASQIEGTPEPPPYVLERIYPKLTFEKPLEIAAIPGTDRLVVVEQNGTLRSFSSTTQAASLLANPRHFDSEIEQVYGIAFHPAFLENRYVYLFTIQHKRGRKNRENGSRILRFKVQEGDPPKLDIKSGKVIFTWLAGGHNGGNLRFGPDGMLYLSTGDGVGPNPPDSRVTGQDISDPLSSILRIDVDRPDPGRAYGIPPDNPFVNLPKARGEVWAFGLRNPWRLSFDSKTGELYTGDVGWELWEMIYRVQRGANFGWSLTEGSKEPVRPDRLKGPGPIVPPLVAHSHEEAASITGGEFYHGSRLPELAGAYLYADYQMGTFWMLRASGDQVTEHRELARSSLMPAGFGLDHAGDFLVCDHQGGGIWQLARNPEAETTSSFPTKLSMTGLFSDTGTQTPNPGVLPYEVIAPRWADHATAERWIAVPGTRRVSIARESKGVTRPGHWSFPTGTVLAKTYSLEMTRGEPDSRRRIETQLLHYDGNLWAAYSYQWNDDQSDANLVGAKGTEANFEIQEANGAKSSQRWRYFSRAECLRCHSISNGFTPGFSAEQLNRGGQAGRLSKLGLLPERGTGLSDPYGKTGSLQTRARSYLHANCSTCHRLHGGGAVPINLDIERSLGETKVLDAHPVQGDLGLPDARVVAPGDPFRSVLLYRMATSGPGHMPDLGGHLVDDRALLLMRDWIASLKRTGDHAAREAERDWLAELREGHTAALDSLLASNSGSLSVLLAILDDTLPAEVREKAIAQGGADPDPMRRHLFERFLPESERRVALGSGFDANALLARDGNPDLGRKIFNSVCGSCHQINGTGIEFGPDLSKIGSKWKKEALLPHLTAPSQVVEPAWQLTEVEMKNGEVRAGLVVTNDDTGITLKMPGGLEEKILAADIAKVSASPVSVMPEGLIENLTAEEAAGLLSYLESLQ